METHEGKPCVRCGGTTRRNHNGDCVACRRRRIGRGSRTGQELNSIRHRSRVWGRVCSLTAADLAGAVATAAGVCPACRAPLVSRTPNAAALDRVFNNQGYTQANVAVLCRRCNASKRDTSSDELFRLATWTRQAEAQAEFSVP